MANKFIKMEDGSKVYLKLSQDGVGGVVIKVCYKDGNDISHDNNVLTISRHGMVRHGGLTTLALLPLTKREKIKEIKE